MGKYNGIACSMKLLIKSVEKFLVYVCTIQNSQFKNPFKNRKFLMLLRDFNVRQFHSKEWLKNNNTYNI